MMSLEEAAAIVAEEHKSNEDAEQAWGGFRTVVHDINESEKIHDLCHMLLDEANPLLSMISPCLDVRRAISVGIIIGMLMERQDLDKLMRTNGNPKAT